MPDLMESTIRKVLIDEGRVSLPGLGTLVRERVSAVLSGADRRLLPPGALITFNENLILNDGRLVRFLAEKKGVERLAAEAMVDEFMVETNRTLNAGESLEINGVGRLFKQFDGALTFTSTGDKLSRDGFGLPSVAFAPVNRRAATPAMDPLASGSLGTAAAVRTAAVPARRKRDAVANLPREAWYVIVGALLLIGFIALYYLIGAVGSQVVDQPHKPIVKRDGTRTEQPVVKPKPEVTPIAVQPSPARDIAPGEPPRLTDARRVSPAPATNTAPDRTNSAPATAPNTKPGPGRVTPERTQGEAAGARPLGTSTAQIATGLFGSQANVRKNVLRIEQAGYKAFTRPAGRYTRVGVEVDYRNKAELDRVLRDVKRKFEESAFVMYIDGKRQR